ncbi:DUF4192 domain-containing protein [uncultured Mycolicibacterium sp.]|uniref:DUF4192 domain-containing protein n=1 Tax=uncultured Mycolicibacterium sp. TaxID=2320817 RepID=UPI00261C03EB|nr:DUF4192 domain-containing protein [uncultured Mycolicibacterium sp.]
MTNAASPDFQLNRPGALIAALPAVLGFVPERSLVLVTLERGALGCVMRVDLTPELPEAADELARVAAAGPADAAVAVIVDDRAPDCQACAAEQCLLADALADALDTVGIELLAVHVVDRVAAGGRWRCVDDCGAAGVVEDPRSSPVALAAVLDGRRLYDRRADLLAAVAPDPARTAAVAAVLGDAASGPGGPRSDADAQGVARAVLAAVDRVADGREPADTELAGLARGLGDVRVREVCYALAVGKRATAAEALWLLLARSTSTPWRTEALVLLAFSAYARGDGPLAGVALDAALADAPGHRMAGMLDRALQRGIHPERIRELALSGYRMAERLGVTLPPRGGLRPSRP